MARAADTAPRFTLNQRLRYRFDNALTRGITLILVWLGLIVLAVILVVAFIVWIWGIGPGDRSVPYVESAWLALTRTLDPGTFGADEGGRFRILMLIVTLAGLFVLAVVIGLVSNAIDRRLELLRQGRSLVVETGHTLILGYSPKVPAIVRELVEANLSRRKPAIVILGDATPSQVHDSIRQQGIDLRNTRLVVRSGNPASLDDLARMNASHARSIIIVAPEDEAADSIVVKNTLALTRFGISFDSTPTIAEVSDNYVAQALVEIGGQGLLTVNPLGTVASITARVLRTSGLGVVYEDILDFRGDEIYSTDIPTSYVGRPFRDLLHASTRSSVIGLLRAGEVLAVPALDTIVMDEDKAIAISADDSSLVLDRAPADTPSQTTTLELPRFAERTLVIGWSRLGSRICLDNEDHVLEGSELTLLIDSDLHDVDGIEQELGLHRQVVRIELGNPVHRGRIDAVLAAGPYHHILVLAEREKLSHQEADARALLALLHIRRWLDENLKDGPRPNLVGELLDVNDEIIGQVAKPDDFIVSERLVSLALSQLSENPAIYPILRQLLNAEGVHVHLLDQSALPLHAVQTFDEVVVAAQMAGAIAIGIQRIHVTSAGAEEATILLNPNKSDRLELGSDDRVVALMRVHLASTARGDLPTADTEPRDAALGRP